MYETEANHKIESADCIPPSIAASFSESKKSVLERTAIPWSEHCTECVWPTCYTTCDLYTPRKDGRCRRFVDGMVRIPCPEASNAYLLKIRFKRWGKLWSPASVNLHSTEHAERMEARDYRLGTFLYEIPLSWRIKAPITNKRYSYKKRIVSRAGKNEHEPTAFLIECYNPGLESIRLSLTLRSSIAEVIIPFQKLIEILPGFNRVRVPIQEINKSFELKNPFSIELIPNDVEKEITLYFGLIEFVREAVKPEKASADGKAKKIKCVIWDLDNTLWDGILVEGGIEKLRLKEGITEVVQGLDSRGILLSIASKNNREDAIAALERFSLNQYFLCPQISWQPKSEGIKQIAQQLNIGMDALLFVDDSAFELEQVKSVCPEVQVFDARQYKTLPELDVCQVPITAESKARRAMYQVESKRQEIAESFGSDYMAFLRDCQIRLTMQPMSEENLERVHELTQRTNQMNFSGNRYDREVLRGILANPTLDTYVLSCKDRFGSYGVIGFSIVDNREPRMTDLMFSCRIQSKRVEHAFLAYVIRKYISQTGKDFCADYRKTPRNAPSGKVFSDIGMKEVEVKDGVSRLVFAMDSEVPDDGVIDIHASDPVLA